MARKRPSSHSDEQFALFLEKARGMLEAEQIFSEYLEREMVGA